MNRALYNALMRLAAPPGRAYLSLSRRHRALLERFAPPVPPLGPSPVWVHACSVGEWAAARPLIDGLRNRWPDLPVVVTVSTVSAMEMVKAAAVPATWFPFDHPASVSGFFDRLQPRALLLIETELWPGVLYEARRRGVPAAVVNGRISDKHLPRYRRAGRLGREMFASLSLAAVQHPVYADRFRALGTAPERIHVAGNVKFDAAPTDPDTALAARIRADAGWPSDAPILVFGSTRPGDEALAMRTYRAARAACPGLRLVIAPRHLERAGEAAAVIDEPYVRRTAAVSESASAPILLLDTLGELNAVYGAAALAVVGGSFHPGVEGHNPIEPSALGAPVLFGPRMRNFRDAAEALVNAGAAVQCHDADSLERMAARLLGPDGKAERERMGAAGLATVAAMRGATDRTLDFIAPLLDRRG